MIASVAMLLFHKCLPLCHKLQIQENELFFENEKKNNIRYKHVFYLMLYLYKIKEKHWQSKLYLKLLTL